MTRPNIIMIFSDQQRWDTIGVYGQKLNVTPNIDQMAREGVRFENAFTCQPVCGPARACLQTGRYASEHGAYINGIPLPNEGHFLAEIFNDGGYETAYVGKWHLASGDGTGDYETKPIPIHLRGGYKDWWIASDILEFTSHGYGGYMFDICNNKRVFTHYRVDATTDYALEYLENKKTDSPFFMMISYIEPHHQNDRHRYEGPDGSKDNFDSFEVPGDLKDRKGDWRENYPDYLGCCHSIDYNLGRIRAYLGENGLEDNTVIIYTSDHGSHFKTRNSEYKRSCHEASIRIPMIIYGDEFTGGKVIDELVSLIDIPRTLLDIANIDRPKEWQGNSLKKLIKGDVSDWPKEVFVQISESQTGRAIRTKRWKFSVVAPGNQDVGIGSKIYQEDFLYDLVNDPYEQMNLIHDVNYNNIREQLKERLIQRMQETREGVPIIIKARSEKHEI